MKRNKEESAFKKKIKELKSTTRGKAILKLIRWGIFFLCLFIFCIIASLISSKTPPAETPNKPAEKNEFSESEKLSKLEKDLANSSFDYEYNITINNEKIVFKGTKTNEKDSGYKNTNAGSIVYTIDKTGTYEEKVNERIPLTNLYEGLNAEYFDINKLINITNKISFTRNTECDCAYPVYDGTLNGITYTLSLNTEETFISGINIKTENAIYDFNFSNVKEQNP